MPGKKNSPSIEALPIEALSIEALIDRLFGLLTPASGARLDPHMALRPDRAARSYFIAAPRPVLTRDDMLRPAREAPFAETERLLADMPAERRAELIATLRELDKALAAERSDESAEPPSLIYALH
jgi:hypothetical protein